MVSSLQARTIGRSRLFSRPGSGLSRRARRPALSELFDLVGALFYVYHGPEDGAHFETVTYHEFSRRWFRFVDDEAPTPLASFDDYVAEEGMSQTEAAEMFDEMMQGFREFLPIFRGDTILYFMQKSHYFLHLASGKTPD